MKENIIAIVTLLFFGSTIISAAQETKTKVKTKTTQKPPVKAPEKEVIYMVADQMPSYPGGDAAYKEYFRNALLPRNFPTSGTVTLSLVIDKTGKPTDIKVVRGLSPEIDAFVIETVREMPLWQPGKKNGQPVSVRLTPSVSVPNAESEEVTAEVDSQIYVAVGQMPEFPGGESRLIEFVSKNIQYPVSAREKNLDGVSVVKFIVQKDGKLASPVILKSLGKDFDAEVLRLVSIMPDWIPGKQNGRAVNVYFMFPIRFKLDKPAEKY